MADATVARLLVAVGVDLNDLNKGFTEADRAVTSFGGKLESTSSMVAKLFTGAAIAGVGAFAAGLGVATKSAMDFEKTLSGVQAVSGATAAQMKQLSDLALQLGADTSFSATEAAAGIEELVKAGVSLGDVMGGAAKASLDLAAAGGISVADAATIASNAMNQFGIKGKDMASVADLIAGAANASAIDVGQFKYSLQAVGAVANTVGLSFKDTATAIAVLGQAGITGSDAGTSLKTMLMGFQPQTKEQITLFKELGLMTKDGANKFFDAKGKLKDFATVSGILQEALKGQSEQQKFATLQTLFGSDAIRAAAIFTKQGAKGFKDMAAAMEGVTAAEVAEKRLDNLSGSLEKLKGSLSTVAITVGMQLTPSLRRLVDWATSVVNYWAPTISLFASYIPAAIDQFGQSLLELGQTVGEFVGLDLDDYAAGWDTWGGIAVRVFELVQTAVSDARDWLADKLGGTISWLTDDVWPAAVDAVTEFAAYVTGPLVGALTNAWGWLNDQWTDALTWLSETGWPAVKNAAINLADWIMGDGIAALRSLWNWLSPKIGDAISWLWRTGWPSLKEAMTTAWTWITGPFMKMLSETWTWLSPKLKAALDWLTLSGWPNLKSAMEGVWNWVTGPLFGMFNTLWEWLAPKVGGALAYLTGTAWPTLTEAMSGVWTWVTETLFPMFSDLWDWLSPYIGGALTWLTDTGWPLMKSAAETVWAWINEILLPTLSDWWSWLSGPLTDVYQWFIDWGWPNMLATGQEWWKWLKESLIPDLKAWWDWLWVSLKPAGEWWIKEGFPGLGGGLRSVADYNKKVIGLWKDLQGELAKTDNAESWVTILENLSRFGQYIVNNLDLGKWFGDAAEGAGQSGSVMSYVAEAIAWISRTLAKWSAFLPGAKSIGDVGDPPKMSGGGNGGSSSGRQNAPAPPSRSGGGSSGGGGGSGGGSGSKPGGGSTAPIIAPQPVTQPPAPSGRSNFDMTSRATMIASAKQIANDVGIGELGAIASAIPIIESGFPGTELGRKYHNWWSIKATSDWKGQTVNMGKVWERIDDKDVMVDARWRAYGSDREAMQDFVDFLHGNQRYQTALSYWDQTKDPVGFIYEVNKAGYATDGSWWRKVSNTAGYSWKEWKARTGKPFLNANGVSDPGLGHYDGYAKGGWITEPILGQGASGRWYTFGENQAEYVIPGDRMGSGYGGTTINVTVNVQGNAMASKRDIADAVIVGLREAQVQGRTSVKVV